jgi:hypothetical protein
MTFGLRIAIALTSIIAPALHFATDVMELANNGFTRPQLWINYIAFIAMPFLFIGLYAVQANRSHWSSLVGAIIYSISFIYFAFTTLFALQTNIPDYPTLWSQVSDTYIFHGGLMIVGGLIFAIASYFSGVLNRIGLILFTAGLLVNMIVAVVPVSELFQIAGSALRNFGLIVIAIGLVKADDTL